LYIKPLVYSFLPVVYPLNHSSNSSICLTFKVRFDMEVLILLPFFLFAACLFVKNRQQLVCNDFNSKATQISENNCVELEDSLTPDDEENDSIFNFWR